MRFDRLRGFIAGGDDGGRWLGRYELLERIGSGGSATVWKARDPELDRLVAIKVLERGEVDRLKQEATAAARLRHPDIVAVHEVGPDYLVMDFIDGSTLAATDRPLAERVRLLEIVARAIHHAHEAGVLHRDLKPTNILVDREGRPVITDFGLAKLLGADDLTRTGAVVGTPGYMAPEQVRGKGQGPQTDVWALGVILHEMITGRRPFAGKTAVDVYDQIVRKEPAAVPGPLGAVVARALEKDPARRYPTAALFADELARHLRGEAVKASRLSRRTRRLAPWGAAGLMILGVLAFALGRERGVPIADTGDLGPSEEALTAALARDPKRADLLLRRAQLRLARGNRSLEWGRNPLPEYAASEADVAAVLALDPGSKEARYCRGVARTQRAYYKLKNGLDPMSDCAGAEEDLSAAIDHGDARAWLSVVHLHRGRWREQQGGDAGAHFATAERMITPPRNASEHLRRGRLLAHVGRLAEAEQEFAAYTKAAERDYWGWLYRGSARRRARDWDAAEAHLTTAIALDPRQPEAREERGRLYSEWGKHAKAVADLEQALRLDPSLAPRLSGVLREARDRAGQR